MEAGEDGHNAGTHPHRLLDPPEVAGQPIHGADAGRDRGRRTTSGSDEPMANSPASVQPALGAR